MNSTEAAMRNRSNRSNQSRLLFWLKLNSELLSGILAMAARGFTVSTNCHQDGALVMIAKYVLQSIHGTGPQCFAISL